MTSGVAESRVRARKPKCSGATSLTRAPLLRTALRPPPEGEGGR
jgi:hypothetical protein